MSRKDGKYEPMQGVRVWKNKKNCIIFRLHYSADPGKTAAWAAAMKAQMSDGAMFQQELEIDFGATGGALIYQYSPEATEVDDFVIPRDWTRFTALDPHPVKPHAFLWGATDPNGIHYIYREYWPSKVYGIAGQVPDVDNRVTIKDYVAVLKFLESEENLENGGFAENIYKRTIDYAARAFGKGTSDDDNPNAQVDFQTRFQREADEIDFDLRFVDAKKDQAVGYEVVNEWLRPFNMEDAQTGIVRPMSMLRIMKGRCPELIWQLRHNRRRKATAQQAENDDPMMRAIRRRNDLTDCIRYLLTGGVEYVDPHEFVADTWVPTNKGTSY